MLGDTPTFLTFQRLRKDDIYKWYLRYTSESVISVGQFSNAALNKRTDGTFYRNDLAWEGGWQGVALRETQDNLAPQSLSDPFGLLPESPTFSSSSETTSILYFGNEFTLVSGIFINTLEFWIPVAGVTYQTLIRNKTDPNNIRSELGAPFIPSSTGYISFPQGQFPAVSGSVYDVGLLQYANTGSSGFGYEWDYERKQGNPDQGKAWHNNASQSYTLRIHQEDKDSVNRSSDLDTVGVGDKISAGGITWTVLQVEKSTSSVYRFWVEPTTRASEDTYTITFEVFGTLPVTYEFISNYWNTNTPDPNILSAIGFREFEGNRVESSDAYPADLTLQEAYVSPDWEIYSYSDEFRNS